MHVNAASNYNVQKNGLSNIKHIFGSKQPNVFVVRL